MSAQRSLMTEAALIREKSHQIEEKSAQKSCVNNKHSSKEDNFFRKYFWEGQKLHGIEQQQSSDAQKKPPQTWFIRYRRLIAILIPMLLVHSIWLIYMTKNKLFYLFTEKIEDIPRYYMSITMIFGSMIAGATSEGGASVAFPVMTLVFGIKPSIARDFSFMIQSVGMTAAAFSIFWMRVQIEVHALIYCSIGGVAGIIFGLEKVAPQLTPPYSKMYFVSIWFAFAFSLFWLNRTINRKVYVEIPDWKQGTLFKFQFLEFNWKIVVLLAAGFLGGIFSSIAGSGIDICSFAILTLLFRVTEKTATPTSVILMAGNTLVGFFWRNFGQGGVEENAWGFLAVCTPIVVVGAPLGSVVGSHLHRLVLASFVYVTDTVQLIGALVVVKPWNYGTKPGRDTPVHLLVTSGVIVFAGAVFFFGLTRIGLFLMQRVEERKILEKQVDVKIEMSLSSSKQQDFLKQSESRLEVSSDDSE
eukprot:TRINITY_DN32986_c0_g2_i2.p1 TRINITY_DN32986_c0_g2~~TRINITY_DN32986_c0_g2_i2.p1  ORF type:complete len:471 (+),score=76.19 TRINITY_DN32986_c0_g2_i2:221-1633(+)